MRSPRHRFHLPATAAIFLVALAACVPGTLRDFVDTTTAVYLTPPSVTVVPVSGTEIRTNDAITVTFDGPVDVSTLVLGGDMAPESDGGLWSTAVVGDDVLTVSPLTLWSVASDHTLIVDCSDTHGNVLDTVSLTFVVLDGIWCVSSTGTDGAAGTRQAPMATIPAAIAAAADARAAGLYDTVEVHVSAGTYTASASGGTMILLVEGVSLLGGYAADFLTRDIAGNETTIEDPATDGGGTWATSNRVIYADIEVTTATLLEGFTIRAGGGLTSVAVVCQEGSPTIRGNHIVQGAATNEAWAVALAASDAVLDQNVVEGVVYASTDSNPVVTANTITTVDGPVEYGLYFYQAMGTVTDNDITLDSSGAGTAIYAVSGVGDLIIQRNRVDAGSPSGSGGYGLYLYQVAGLVRDNDIILGATGETGIWVEASVDDLAIQGNRVDAGSLTGSSKYCLYIQDASPVVSGNTLDGGSGGIPTCLHAVGSTPLVFNNLILAGVPDGASTTIGIYLDASSAEIYNNTIVVPNIANAFGVQMTGGSVPRIINDVIYLQGAVNGTCIDETGNGDLAEVRTNTIWRPGAGSLLYTDTTGFAWDSLDDVALAYPLRISANVNEDPVFANIDGADNDLGTMTDNNWRLTVDADTAVKTGGVDGSAALWGFSTDFTGATRSGNGTTGWSMGAYEY